MNNSKKVAF